MNDEGFTQTYLDAMDREWLRGGVIVHAGVVHTVAVYDVIFVMDVRRWAMALAEGIERDEKTDVGRVFASALYQWALSGDAETVNSLTALREMNEPVFRRARIGFLKVNEDNFYEYVQAVLDSATPAKLNLRPAFLFVTGPRQPQIFSTQEMSYYKKFAEKWVRWETVTKVELRSQLDRVALEYPGPHSADTVPRQTLKHRFEPDDPAFRKRRQALLLMAQIFDISLSMSDTFATDLDALEARLAAHPAWPARLFEEVLQAALVVVSTNSDWMARRRSNMRHGSSHTSPL